MKTDNNPMHIALRHLLAATRLLIALVLLGSSASFAEDNSETVVKQLIEHVSNALDKLYQANRIDDRSAIEQMIRTEIVPHIDKEYLTRRVFRQFWPQIVQAGREQDAQQRVIESVVRTYAVALSSYSGDTLSVISVREEGKKSTARTRIRRPNGQLIQVDFSLSDNTGPWLINDMAVDGIVQSLTLFNAIKPIWEQDGMEAALNAVREKDTAPSPGETKKE
ncbi:MAG TPA: ABC transporter substrate-binding protein [Spongiibacteraceae bacterium]|nr:ABC transporter substrate-binding protein [Spongiibacteraceae bacterium]